MTDFSLLTPIYSAGPPHPLERWSFLRGATHFFHFGGKAYEIAALSGTLSLKESANKPSWVGVALRVAALFTLILPLLMLIAALIYRSTNSFDAYIPDICPDALAEVMAYLNVQELIKMREVSKRYRFAAENELIRRLNDGKVTPLELGITCPRALAVYFEARAKNITRIDFTGSREVIDLSWIDRFPKLMNLKLSACKEIWNWSSLRHCLLLTSLDLSDCSWIRDFNFLEHCPGLTRLELFCNSRIRHLDFLRHCPLLQSLGLFGCSELTSIDPLSFCPKLNYLNMTGCHRIENFTSLQQCRELQILILSGCEELDDISFAANLRNLIILTLSGCYLVHNINPLEHCKELLSLNITDCPLVSDILPLNQCRNLTDLRIINCTHIPRDQVEGFINRGCTVISSRTG